MRLSTLLHYALAGVFVLAGTGFAQAQRLVPKATASLAHNSSDVTSEITRPSKLVRTLTSDTRNIDLFSSTSSINTSCNGPASVPRGGQATFTYQVCNTTNNPVSGVVYYELFFVPNGVQVGGPFQVAAGSIPALSCSPNTSFTVNVPPAMPMGNWEVVINAGPSLGTSASNCTVPVMVFFAPPPPDHRGAKTGSLASAEPWTTSEAAARTAEVGAYPNPLRSETTIQYELAERAEVRLAVYDVLGRTVAVLTEGTLEAGTHAATFDARGLATGTYVYRLQVGDAVQTGRLTVVN